MSISAGAGNERAMIQVSSSYDLNTEVNTTLAQVVPNLHQANIKQHSSHNSTLPYTIKHKINIGRIGIQNVCLQYKNII